MASTVPAGRFRQFRHVRGAEDALLGVPYFAKNGVALLPTKQQQTEMLAYAGRSAFAESSALLRTMSR